MKWKRIKDNLSDKFSNKIDEGILNYIDGHIDDNMSELEKSIIIYLCLGDILSYSPEFSLFYNYNKVLPVKDVTLDNSEIICKNWSILYHKLLKRYNINSKLIRKGAHYRVEIVIDNVIYSADATGYGGGGFYYSMSDIARIKYGFKIQRFIVANTVDYNNMSLFEESYKSLNGIVSDIYRKQGRKYYSDTKIDLLKCKVIKLIVGNAKKVGIGTFEDIDYRIKMINRFWGLDISQFPLEKVQLFNSFFKDLFEDYEEYGLYEVKSFNIYARVDDKVVIYKLLAFDIDNEFYYYFDNGKQFERYSKKELIEEFRIRNVRMSEFTEIPGIYGELEFHKVKAL